MAGVEPAAGTARRIDVAVTQPASSEAGGSAARDDTVVLMRAAVTQVSSAELACLGTLHRDRHVRAALALLPGTRAAGEAPVAAALVETVLAEGDDGPFGDVCELAQLETLPLRAVVATEAGVVFRRVVTVVGTCWLNAAWGFLSSAQLAELSPLRVVWVP